MRHLPRGYWSSPGGVAAMIAAGLLVAVLVALESLSAAVRTTTDPLAVTVVETNPATGETLASEPALELSATRPAAGTPVIDVDTAVRLQRITGFGGAMTDSSAELIERHLSTAARGDLMADLFGVGGLGLNTLRVPMGASDFSATEVPYSYDDGAPDPALQRFSIAHDTRYILPALRQALANDPRLQILATPWSVPGWMKANDALDDRGRTGTLLPADFSAYAAYFVKFLRAYAKAGVRVAAITPANEPTTPTAYPGMNISAATEVELINRYLTPALRAARLTVKLYGSDLGWGTAAYARRVATSAAAGDLAGIAWHCYYGDPRVMSQVRALDPRLSVQMTECSPGIATVAISEVVIGSLRNWASQVDLWNLALDPEGGPVQPPNHGCGGCSGLVTINPQTGTVSADESYWELGQASEFIEPGAVRVRSNSFVRYDYTQPGADYISAGIDDVAAVNPDGSIALMAYNNARRPRTFAVRWQDRSFSDTLAPGATVSFRWR
jgi:O-glycosyl hydrolase